MYQNICSKTKFKTRITKFCIIDYVYIMLDICINNIIVTWNFHVCWPSYISLLS